MDKLQISIIFCLFAFISKFGGSSAIDCYICNSAFETEVKEDACRYPEKDPNFKPKECNDQLLRDLNEGWMSERWNWENQGPHNLNEKESSTPQKPYKYGYEKKPGYTLKCMKEVLHKKSKPWLQHKPENFSQVVRFCEYRDDKEDPPCDKACDAQQLKDGSCYLCCSGSKCNGASSLNPTWKIVAIAIPVFALTSIINKLSIRN